MKLSLAEAATVLGKSRRQLRYLIQTERLPATKAGGRWQIDSSDLPLTAAQRKALATRLKAARQAIDQGLLPAAKAAVEEPRRQYSVTDLGAFQSGEEIYREAVRQLGRDDPGSIQLAQALVLVSRGCHTFQPADKASRFLEARDAAATAVAELLLADDDRGDRRRQLADRIEQELIPKIAGLVAVHEKRSRRSRFERFAAVGAKAER